MTRTIRSIIITLMSCSIIAIAISAHSKTFNNDISLDGLESTQTIFDINIKDAGKLALYLQVIKMTYDDIVSAGLKPKMVIAFRGPSVRLINSETGLFEEEDQQSLSQAAGLMAELTQLGVRLEACAIAINLFKVDSETLLPGISVVGNTFVSLTGYQNRGYAIVPIQ
ncbi:DsrE family protein [Desulforhopalus sp. 52FAK]